ncbi:MAG: aminoacyl-histidine dipeptidase [Ignavibacteria bacterium]|nr:aminoacyl-histidine dipeptidase [Ignavibacteria bacterium]
MTKDIIAGLEPKLLWEQFYEITQVPRPSKKEEKILNHLKSFCNKNGIQFKQDATGNLLLSIPATSGKEESPIIVLQAHIDMVCEKNKGTDFDFENDPLKLSIENGWIKAEGTTLGADNGIGVAAALAIAIDKDSVHGPLEILLTVDEETGLTGAKTIQPDFISGKTLLNLDSEEDGAFYIGCSGGIDTMGEFIPSYDTMFSNYNSYELLVTGLKGGHSGLEINAGRANAIKLLTRLLSGLRKLDYRIAEISGGSKRNAIPREAEAIILLHPEDYSEAKRIIEKYEHAFIFENKTADNGVKVNFVEIKKSFDKAFTRQFGEWLTDSLLALPHGVIQMSSDIEGLVETSTNLATLKYENDRVFIGTSQRSSIESSKRYIADSVRSVFVLAHALVKTGDGYPGWKPDVNSNVLIKAKEVFRNLFNKEPEVKAIHAGLECGLLGAKYPGLDMISFGPTILGAHSPDEKVEIVTVEKFYRLLKELLKDLV